MLLLCNPARGDRFDRNTIAYAAYVHTHGQADIPKGPKHFILYLWQERMKAMNQDGRLSKEKAEILESLQFNFAMVRPSVGCGQA